MKRFHLYLIALIASCVLLVAQVQAEEADARGANPIIELQQGLEGLIVFLRTGPTAAELGNHLETQIAGKFDFEFMARAATGPIFPELDAAQQDRLVRKLKVMFLTAMAEKLAMYDNQDIAYLQPRRSRHGQVMVSAMVNNPGRYPARVDFRMHQTEDGWKVYDVVGNGASAVAFYRAYFRSVMR